MLNPSGNTFTFHEWKVVFNDNGEQRVHYTSDRRYYESLVARWGHLSDLHFEKVAPTAEEQDRLHLLNEANIEGAGMYAAEAIMYVQHNAVAPDSFFSTLSNAETNNNMLTLLKNELKDAAREQRWKVETGGAMVNGMAVRTDPTSQQRVGNLVTNILADTDANHFDFESEPGVWITVNRDIALAIGKALSAHVQACFTRCKELHEEIDTKDFATLHEVDVTSGWPTYQS